MSYVIDDNIMKRQIRQGVFETNSSSTHTISISKKNNGVLDKLSNSTVEFVSGEFGWEFEVYNDTYSKASYLWTAIVKYYEDQCKIENIKNNIEKVLDSKGIKCIFEPYIVSKSSDGKYTWYDFERFAYIDHEYNLGEFLSGLFPNEGEDVNEELLLSYLFNPNSYVETGNDNDDTPESMYAKTKSLDTDDAVEFYKGN